MDAETIGKTILLLRKQKNLTQVQLAEQLNVSDKAISKWEQGLSIPDFQQIDSLVKYFGISYDNLFSGNVPDEPIANSQTSKIKRKKFNSKEWYKLDNAAKVYPPQANSDWSLVFRVSATLKYPVDRQILQNALEDIVDRFPTFMVTIKKGLFWYYFERMEKVPMIVNGNRYPMRTIPLNGKHYLFRVTCEDKRIGLEVFHSITDGTGASIFLNTLLTRYYELKYGAIEEHTNAKNVFDNVKSGEVDDSFARYSKKKNYAKRVMKSAYHVKGRKIKNNTVIQLITDATKLHDLAKKYGGTITEFLTAIMAKSYFAKREYDKDTHPVIVQVPINLRKVFQSETLRNFSLFCPIEFDDTTLNTQALVNLAKEQLARGIDKENLQQNINVNIREERNKIIRLAPLFLKNFGFSIANKIYNVKSFSTTISNLGNFSAPKELSAIVDRFDFILKEPPEGGTNFSVISYNNKCVISMVRSIWEPDIECEFVKLLVEEGLEFYVETNGGALNENL
ncbi:MAG: helix-turn-helix domain-containing protein [Clostridia bacterium]